MLDDYLKTNPGAKDLSRPGIELQPPHPQSDAITIRPWRPPKKRKGLLVPNTTKKKRKPSPIKYRDGPDNTIDN